MKILHRVECFSLYVSRRPGLGVSSYRVRTKVLDRAGPQGASKMSVKLHHMIALPSHYGPCAMARDRELASVSVSNFGVPGSHILCSRIEEIRRIIGNRVANIRLGIKHENAKRVRLACSRRSQAWVTRIFMTFYRDGLAYQWLPNQLGVQFHKRNRSRPLKGHLERRSMSPHQISDKVLLSRRHWEKMLERCSDWQWLWCTARNCLFRRSVPIFHRLLCDGTILEVTLSGVRITGNSSLAGTPRGKNSYSVWPQSQIFELFSMKSAALQFGTIWDALNLIQEFEPLQYAGMSESTPSRTSVKFRGSLRALVADLGVLVALSRSAPQMWKPEKVVIYESQKSHLGAMLLVRPTLLSWNRAKTWRL